VPGSYLISPRRYGGGTAGACSLLLCLALLAPSPAGARSAKIAAAVARVSPIRIAKEVRALAALSRDATEPGFQSATDLVRARLEQTGLTVRLDPFDLGGKGQVSNVVAVAPGVGGSRPVLIVSAHYDSICRPGPGPAPGAEDNASGTAALLEIARVLAGEKLATEVWLVAFAGEEHGLWGSRHLAALPGLASAAQSVINMDMVGYRPGDRPTEALLDGYPTGRSLEGRLAWAAQIYAALPCSAGLFSEGHSDHRPFADLGIPSITVASAWWRRYPHYHTSQDLPDQVDATMVAAVARAVAAHVLLAAGFADGPPVAVAGDFVEAEVDREVELSGAASFDPRGQPLSLEWRRLDGPAVAIEASGETLRFTPAEPGVYRFLLHARAADGRVGEPALAAVIVRDEGGCAVTGKRRIPETALCALLLLLALRRRIRSLHSD